MDLTLLLEGNSAGSGSGTTGSDGSITFRLRNAAPGTYTASVTDVTAAGYVWDDVDTPSNEYTKQ